MLEKSCGVELSDLVVDGYSWDLVKRVVNSCYFSCVNPNSLGVLKDPVREVFDNALPRALEITLLDTLLNSDKVCPHMLFTMRFAYKELQHFGLIGDTDMRLKFIDDLFAEIVDDVKKSRGVL